MRTNMATTDVQVLGFKKDKGIWYADLPEFLEEGLGTTADLMMVDGSDKFLDILSGNQNAVVLKIPPQKFNCINFRAFYIKFTSNTIHEILSPTTVFYLLDQNSYAF